MTHENITGKAVFITGASSGIGEAIARHLAARGAKVVIAARRKDKLEKIAAEIHACDGEAFVQELDITDAEAVKAAVNRAAAHYGRLDVMVNNAGTAGNSPLSHLDIAAWNRMVDINIKGVLYGIAAALPIFEAQKSGHFINIASVAGIRVLTPGAVVYSATKFAVRAISTGLRLETDEYIRVTSLCPGATQSEIFPKEAYDKASEEVLEKMKKTAIPAEFVARAAAYAISQPDYVDIDEVVVRPAVEDF